MRRVWVGLLFAAWVGVAAAQPPDVVLIQKTAGQPDRKLKLIKMLDGAEGERFAEVQDVASGARYQLPMAALAGMTRVAAEPAPAAKPAASGGKFPTSLPLPAPPAGGFSPFASRPLPTAQPTPRPRPAAPAGLDTPLTAMVGGPPPAPTPGEALTLPAPTRAATPAPPATVAALVRQRFDAGRPTEPTVVPQPLFPTHTPPATLAVLPPFPAMEPAAPPQPMPAAAPKPMPAAAPAPPPEPPMQPAGFHLAVPPPAAWPADAMQAEIEPYTTDLQSALRPSVRERAATYLANCRHASRPEVKQLLAQAAATDPAPAVQAHCVRILSALGYHAREHVEFLEVALGSDHTGLRQAAAAALAKLTPR